MPDAARPLSLGARPRRPVARGARGALGMALLVTVASGFALPGHTMGLFLDDWVHRSMIEGTYPSPRAPWELYDVVGDDDRDALRDAGLFPWWGHPRFAMRFLRPLSSVLRWADHRVFGDDLVPMHVHSLLWWIAAVVAARAFFRRVVGPRAAAIATIVFALTPAHAIPVAWLAHRHSIVSLALGTLGLVVYLRWRETRRLGLAAAATGLFALAFAGGESALGLTGYVLALETTRRRDRVAARLSGLLPFVSTAATYFAIRSALGYGVVGSSYYVDPIHDTSTFLASAPRRFEWLLFDAWTSVPPSVEWDGSPPTWARAVALVALGCVVLVLAPIGPRRTGVPPPRALGALVLGSTIALAPALAIPEGTRLLGLPMLGVAPIVGLVLDAALDLPARRPGTMLARARSVGLAAVTVLFVLAHLVRGPIATWLVGTAFRGSALAFAAQAASMDERLATSNETELVVVRSDGATVLVAAASRRAPDAPRFHVLAVSDHVLVHRVGPRTLDVTASRGGVLFPPRGFFGYAFDDARPGDVVDLSGMVATITAVEDGRVSAARFELDPTLEGASFVEESSTGYRDAVLPAEGFGAPFDVEAEAPDDALPRDLRR